MRKRIQEIVLVMVVAAIFSSCAATNMRMRGNFNQDEKVLDLLIEPHDSAGVSETPKILRGEFACFDVLFPEELKNERYIPERIKWYALVLSQGYEYLGQIVLMFNGETELLVDGTAKALKNAKALVLSTRAEKVYGIQSDAKGIDADRGKLMFDAAYRQDLIEKYGTSLSDFKQSDKLINEINHWNRFDSLRGYILTPLDEKRFREIVSINPGNTYSQRLVNQPWVISTNPVQMVLQDGIVNHINAAISSPNTEWRSNRKTQTQQEE